MRDLLTKPIGGRLPFMMLCAGSVTESEAPNGSAGDHSELGVRGLHIQAFLLWLGRQTEHDLPDDHEMWQMSAGQCPVSLH